MKKLDPKSIECKFDHSWYEDVAGDGGSRMPMFECECDVELSPKDQERLDICLRCGPECPGYRPVPVLVCKKHNCEYTGSCTACENEFYDQMEKALEENATDRLLSKIEKYYDKKRETEENYGRQIKNSGRQPDKDHRPKTRKVPNLHLS